MSEATAPAAVNVLPRGVLMLIGALVLAALLGTAAVRLSGVSISEPDAQPVGPPQAQAAPLAAAEPAAVAPSANCSPVTHGEQGFLRGTLRALARERKRIGAGSEAPFELVLRSDARLTLMDPVTQQRIDLESFGPTNAGVFARLLNREAPRQP